MKKVLLTTGIAVLALATLVSAAYDVNLTVGSTGTDVVALQTALISAGFDIPAITSGAAAPGYFGSQTKAAVKLYQASRVPAIPNTGFVGPLTRGALNGGGVATAPVSNCLAGWSAATYQGVSYCLPPGTSLPAGSVVTPVVAGTPALDNTTDGSITVTINTSPANATIMKKGDTANVMSAKFKATAGPVSVSRYDYRFDKRAWLYFDVAQLVDDSGAVVAQKTGLSQADFTELTVNTSYLLRFDAFNYTVAPGADKSLTLKLHAIPSSDRTAVTITVTSPASSIRTLNGKGYTDSLGDATLSRTITYQAATAGNLIVSLDTGSVPAGQFSVSQSGETFSPLAVVSLRAENSAVTVNTLKVKLNVSDADLVTGLDLYNGLTKIASADAVTATSTFSDLNVVVDPAVAIVKLTIKARIAGQGTTPIYADGSTATVTVYPDTTSVVSSDALYNTATVAGSTFTSNTQTYLYKNVAFAKKSVFGLVALRNSTTAAKTALNDSAKDYMDFTVTAGSYDVFLVKGAMATSSATTASTTPGVGVIFYSTASTTGSTANLSGLDLQSGETGTYTYKIPSGQARTFRLNVSIDNTNGTAGFKSVVVSGFGWNTSDLNTGTSLYTSNLTDFQFATGDFGI